MALRIFSDPGPQGLHQIELTQLVHLNVKHAPPGPMFAGFLVSVTIRNASTSKNSSVPKSQSSDSATRAEMASAEGPLSNLLPLCTLLR